MMDMIFCSTKRKNCKANEFIFNFEPWGCLHEVLINSTSTLPKAKFWSDIFDPQVTYCVNSILGFSDQYHLCKEKKGLDTFEGLNWLPSGSES